MTSIPLVSVALAAYQNEHTIATAIQSVLDQTLPEFELIIVDDGSRDATTAVIERFTDPRIKLLREPAGNIGHAARLNQCVRAATGRYVARMDGDDVMFPERLARQVEYLESHPGIDLVGTAAIVFKAGGEGYGIYPGGMDHRAICRSPWWGFPLAHPTWMARRTWFLKHPYREVVTRSEDQELLLSCLGDSRFAALGDVLLGYRMEKVMAMKFARGRVNYCLALIRRARNLKSMRIAARGVAVHALGYVRDTLLDATGTLNDRARHFYRSVDPATAALWRQVWQHATRFGTTGPQ